MAALTWRVPIAVVVAALAGGIVGGRATHAEDRTGGVEVMLAIDTSGSMRNAIEAAKAAANEFVVSMPNDVRIGVETFGDDVTVLTPPTRDRTVVRDQINGIVADGDTALYDAVVTASQQFTPSADEKVLVVLSDGKDDGSTATLEQAVEAVQDEHVEAISLTTSETDLASLTALGTVTSADDPAGVSAAFARVADLVTEVVKPTTTPAPTTTAPPTTTTTTPPTTTTAAPSTTAAAPSTTATPPPPPPTPAPPAAGGTTPDASDSSRSLWLGALGVFAGMFLLGLVLLPRQRVSKARLGIRKPRSVSDIGKRTTSAVEEALARHGKRDELATALSVANIAIQPGEFVGSVTVVALVAGLVGLFLGGPLAAVIVAVAICLAARFYVRFAKTRRQVAFADQLPDVLQLVTTALRSGYGLTQALDAVAEEAEEPARGEFARVLVEARLGRDLSDALRALADRMESKDLAWVVSAIDINRDTGGNLSEVLHTVGTTIRERQRMARHVRTLTAEGRLSAKILTAMPFFMALVMWKVNPNNFALLTHGVGLVALGVGGIFLLLGSLWVRRIVNSIAL